VECLKDTGIQIQEGEFKKRTIEREFHPYGNKILLELIDYEEKETDVAIGCLTLAHLMDENIDGVALMTGDTDILPAIKIAKSLFNQKQIFVLFPYKRHNDKIKKFVDKSFDIHRSQFCKHQFPDPYIMTNRSEIPKPTGW